MATPNLTTPNSPGGRFRLRVAWGRLRRGVRALLLIALFAVSQPLVAAQPPTASAQDGFVPVSRTAQQETIPAARLVVIAYGFAWVMLLGYLWSIWSRLGKVERELHTVSRRIETGDRRA